MVETTLAPRLTLADHHLERLDGWAREGYPVEVCGLLVGRTRGDTLEVHDVLPARNLERDPRRHFRLDPQDHLETGLSAERRGLEILGVWHTHPDHPASPSATDLEHAWEVYAYLILSVDREQVRERRCWRLRSGRFEAIPIEEGP